MTEDHRHIRREYVANALRRKDLTDEPLALFSRWLNEAFAAGGAGATAMRLATADAEGTPAVRVVLLKAHGPEGFVFYTDYGSAKGADLAVNPRAELMFFWREMNRQVRVSGAVAKMAREDAEAYFVSRPKASQVSAAASDQSQPIDSREVLEARVRALDELDALSCPEDWGGYCLTPKRIEFWQGRESRLHDRFVYQSVDESVHDSQRWQVTRLQP